MKKTDYISKKIYHFINSGERKLTKSILNFNKWEKGQTDLCEFVFADLGEIEFVTIGLYHPSGNWTLFGKKHGCRLTIAWFVSNFDIRPSFRSGDTEKRIEGICNERCMEA